MAPMALTFTTDLYVSPHVPFYDLCWDLARTCSGSSEPLLVSIRLSFCLRPGNHSVSLLCGQRQEQGEINSRAMKLIFKLNTILVLPPGSPEAHPPGVPFTSTPADRIEPGTIVPFL